MTYGGPALTIADCRKLGMAGLRVRCAAPFCYNTSVLRFEALNLPDSAGIRDVRKLRQILCQRCGGRDVNVSGDWAGTAM